MRALLIMFLVVAILTPGLLLGILVSPWFYFILFLLLLATAVPFLVPKSETTHIDLRNVRHHLLRYV